MIICLEKVSPDLIGNKYLTIGILDRKDWREANKGKLNSDEILDRINIFKNVLKFELIPGGWYPASDMGTPKK